MLMEEGREAQVEKLKYEAKIEEIRKTHGEAYLKEYLRKEKLEEMEEQDVLKATIEEI
jgi:hypothetical protein